MKSHTLQNCGLPYAVSPATAYLMEQVALQDRAKRLFMTRDAGIIKFVSERYRVTMDVIPTGTTVKYKRVMDGVDQVFIDGSSETMYTSESYLTGVIVFDALAQAYDRDHQQSDTTPSTAPSPSVSTQSVQAAQPVQTNRDPAQEMAKADRELTAAWMSLTQQQRNALRGEERFWASSKDKLPVEQRTQEIKNRMAYLRSIAHS